MKFSRSVYAKVGVAALALAAAGTASVAQARSDVYFSVGVSNAPAYYPPVYVQPQPVYVQPAPVYVQPAPVYYSAAPVYYNAAPVVYVRPAPVYYYGGGYYGRGDWRARQYWRHQHRD